LASVRISKISRAFFAFIEGEHFEFTWLRVSDFGGQRQIDMQENLEDLTGHRKIRSRFFAPMSFDSKSQSMFLGCVRFLVVQEKTPVLSNSSGLFLFYCL